jgi:hypothetical protein
VVTLGTAMRILGMPLDRAKGSDVAGCRLATLDRACVRLTASGGHYYSLTGYRVVRLE